MRTAAFLVLVLCAVAHAGNRIVVMSERDDLSSALQLALAGRQADVAAEPASPAGEQRLDRAASAQRTAIADHADIAVWIDGDEVWVVLADGRDVRHAPLPTDASPRVFAAVTTSLIDELVAPPVAPPVSVDVHVDVSPAPVAAAPPPPPTAAPVAPVVLAPPSLVAQASELPAHSGPLLELGATVSSASLGGQVELLYPLGPSLRIGFLAGLASMFDGFAATPDGAGMVDAGVELRHVGTGKTHFDFGPELALARDSDGDQGGIAAFRFGLTHELDRMAITGSIAPMYLFGFGYLDSPFSVVATLAVGLPL